MFGDPDYDAVAALRQQGGSEITMTQTAHPDPYAVRNVRSGCGLLYEMHVTRLPETGLEALNVTGLWKREYSDELVETFIGLLASEEQFKNSAHGKRAIHVATHGYYLQASCGETLTSSVSENPLLLSGLLLAGANLHGRDFDSLDAEDGILTALEVSAMDLRGTDLVVLSACETGLGKVEQGEGVYGLRRAFQMAGAKTVVSSLWKIPDKESMQFMKTLYSTKAKTYPELMQQVALRRIREARLRGRPTHPFTWGAFVATGDWRIR